MAKTNKEVRSDLAKEMRDKRKEKNTQLEQVEKSNFSEGLKDSMRKEIKENFEKDIDAIKSRPGYAEAKKTHLEEIKAKVGVNAAKKEKERLQKEYEEKLAKADAENDGKISQEKKEKLYGNREAIIKDLKENYLKENDAEVMGYKGKEVHFSLPAVGNFEGFKLDYFVSDEEVYKKDFESNPELEKKSKSMKQIGEILKAVNRYMAELGVETDGDMDYENDLQYYKTMRDRCEAGNCLKDVTGLYKCYWTSDKDVYGLKNSRVRWYCFSDGCSFFRDDYDDYANLFLGLSD